MTLDFNTYRNTLSFRGLTICKMSGRQLVVSVIKTKRYTCFVSMKDSIVEVPTIKAYCAQIPLPGPSVTCHYSSRALMCVGLHLLCVA